jgi:hypothetical protein
VGAAAIALERRIARGMAVLTTRRLQHACHLEKRTFTGVFEIIRQDTERHDARAQYSGR